MERTLTAIALLSLAATVWAFMACVAGARADEAEAYGDVPSLPKPITNRGRN